MKPKSILVFIFVLVVAASGGAFAQGAPDVAYQAQAGPMVTTIGAQRIAPGAPVQGAPYSATITNESVQVLADGNRIVQTSDGTISRDSEGRTRQDAPLPTIGNLSAANAPHLVFIQDPVAQTAYTLNLTDKTAQKMPMPPAEARGVAAASGQRDIVFMNAQLPDALPETLAAPLPPPTAIFHKTFVAADGKETKSENLGTQTMEGVTVNGVRTTRTIPAGQIGNEKPIEIVTEVWTSPELKTVVYSKRSDPRMGEQTFRLTNMVRAEPDASLFAVPADFKMVEGPHPIIYRMKQ